MAPPERTLGARLRAAVAGALLVATGGAARADAQPPAAARGTGSVVGTVYDSLARAPLAGALVQLAADSTVPDGPVHNARTDTAGRFRIDGVVPGVYLAMFGHPALDSLGIEAPLRRVTVDARVPTPLALAIPRPRRIVATLCAGIAADSAALLVGHVRDAATRAPRPDATLSLSWSEVTIRKGAVEHGRPTLAVPVSEAGWFAVCDAPSGVELLVRAAAGADTSGHVIVEIPPGGILRRDLHVGPSTALGGDQVGPGILRARTGPARLRGVVRDGRGPVAGARVRVWGSRAETVTNDAGAFALAALPAGSQMLDVRAVGYLPTRRAVELLVDDTTGGAPTGGAPTGGAPTGGAPTINDVALRILSVQDFLDTVRVHAAVAYARDGTGFERRRRGGRGEFLTRADIARRPATDFTNLLATMHGVDVRDELDPRSYVQHRTVYLRGSAGQRCRATVYVDGLPVGADDLDAFVWTSEIDAMEVYDRAARVPAQYRDSPDCGLILVWTERFRARARRAGR